MRVKGIYFDEEKNSYDMRYNLLKKTLPNIHSKIITLVNEFSTVRFHKSSDIFKSV